MVDTNIIVLSTILSCAWASTYHPISFLPPTKLTSSFNTYTIHDQPIIQQNKIKNINKLLLNDYNYFSPFQDALLNQNYFFKQIPLHNYENEAVGPLVHTTPDFSNGLEYPDPLLITGVLGKSIAKLLYSEELFFSDYPHLSALLNHQKVRRENGLDGNNLGSLRPTSPFYRFRKLYAY